jgi:hypothetical protein
MRGASGDEDTRYMGHVRMKTLKLLLCLLASRRNFLSCCREKPKAYSTLGQQYDCYCSFEFQFCRSAIVFWAKHERQRHQWLCHFRQFASGADKWSGSACIDCASAYHHRPHLLLSRLLFLPIAEISRPVPGTYVLEAEFQHIFRDG